MRRSIGLLRSGLQQPLSPGRRNACGVLIFGIGRHATSLANKPTVKYSGLLHYDNVTAQETMATVSRWLSSRLHPKDETMFLRKLLLGCLSLTLSAGAIADDPAAPQVEKQAVVDLSTCAKPVWPKESLTREEAGAVNLMFLISVQGDVVNTAITRSSGYVSLDEAAVKGIRKCKFVPGMNGGKPVEAWMRMQYVWTLEDDRAIAAKMLRYREDALKGDIDAVHKLAKGYQSLRTPADVALGVRMHQAAAAQNHAGALFELSQAHRNGLGLPQNQIEGMTLLRKAADRNSPEAQLALGWIYKYGTDGVELDLAQAAAWFKKAAEKGEHNAQNVLGEMYRAGEGVPRDPVAAAKWFQISANGGLADAQRSYAMALMSGEGAQRDLSTAAVWFRKAADQHDPVAQGILGMLHFSGNGVEVNDAEAFRFLNRAAYASQTKFQVMLGDLHAKGIRTPVDHKQANALYRRAAELDNAAGMNNLGHSYEKGLEVKQDYAVAMDWYLRAVARGDGNAKAAIGGLYENGLGVEKNLATALKWYMAAASQKNADGMRRLATLHENGTGVKKDDGTALDWYGKAASEGDEMAMRRLGVAHINGELGLPVNADLGKQWLKTAELRKAGLGTIFTPEGYKPPPVK